MAYLDPEKAREARKRYAKTEKGRAAQRRYNQRRKERQAQLVSQANARRRARAIEALGGACTECGTCEELRIHHTHGGGTEDRRRRSMSTILLAIIDGEPGFELLCEPHHRQHHHGPLT
jgi:hypothetical protein